MHSVSDKGISPKFSEGGKECGIEAQLVFGGSQAGKGGAAGVGRQP